MTPLPRRISFALPLALFAVPAAFGQPVATVDLDTSVSAPMQVVQTPEYLAGNVMRFEGELLDPGGDWFVIWSFDVNPDPREPVSIRGDADFQNLSGSDIDFEFVFTAPVCPVILNASRLGASVSARLLSSADGGSITADPGESVWAALPDGVIAERLFWGPFALTASGAGTSSTSANFGTPYPSEPGPPIETDLAFRLNFTLTSNDTAEFGSNLYADGDPENLRVCAEDATGTTAGDQFGFAAANAGDVNGDGVDDMIVGAPYNDDNGTNAGRVYVISGLTGEVLYSRRGGHPGNRLGWSVSGAGDVNGDGYDDFIGGAPYYADKRGRARVYSGADGSTLYILKGRRTGDRFGWSVSGGVDVDNDGRDDLIVGAPYNDDGPSNGGQAYAYSGRTGDKLGSIKGENGGDLLGWSVAALGRANSDSYADFIAGAPKHDDGGSNRGKVYVVSGRNFSVLYDIRGKRAGDQFGRAVAAAGRVDSDGRDDFVVGAPYFDNGARTSAGRVEVYAGRDGERLWAKSGSAAGDRLGWAVAGAGDINGDGRADVLVGAPWFDVDGGANVGRAYVRSGVNGATLDSVIGTKAGDKLGHALAGLFTVIPEILVGVPKADTAAGNAGAVVRVAY
ncbi:MAG: hypothetical protein HKO59_07065 [Phycisphaerales bacterium]|nr:integrin alpha [Phycisphaerae bacterium]NNF44468.1 hypothetical protein [Phycisphaerales bacterium]NNM25734.1 hypothetical protein [Phycisphaerales bacterium]